MQKMVNNAVGVGTVRPDYIIKDYGYVVSKVIRFNKNQSDIGRISEPNIKAEPKSYDVKLQESVSRARSVVIQKALCNPWQGFITLTLDAKKYNRYNLEEFHHDLTQWLRNKSRIYGQKIWFLLVPEEHKDGAVHMHGFISGIPLDKLEKFVRGKHPWKLVSNGYLNWPDYESKFGFCSIGNIRSMFKAALYMSKYISKSMADRAGEKGAHLYYSSRGLRLAEDDGYSYGVRRDLDKLLSYHGEFVSTGWVTPTSLDIKESMIDEWVYKDIGYYDPLWPDDEPDINPLELSPDFTQLSIDGWKI